jgi:hypothetical protein
VQNPDGFCESKRGSAMLPRQDGKPHALGSLSFPVIKKTVQTLTHRAMAQTHINSSTSLSQNTAIKSAYHHSRNERKKKWWMQVITGA